MPDNGDWLSDSTGRRLPHGSWPPSRTAPDPIEPLRQFVNTRNLHNGADILGTVGEMHRWLDERGRPSGGLDRRVLAELHDLRDVLHRLTIGNAAGSDVTATETAAAWADLTAIARAHPVQFSYVDDVAVRPVSAGASGFIADALAMVAGARLDGTFALLKACHDETCRWVVFDRSKNHSAAWCSAGTCGGKARARTYRARARS